jgi:hypothetical protein
MPTPVGMSGGPVFRVQKHLNEPFECFGMVFSERITQTPEGVLQFGTALRLDTLRDAIGPATDNVPLAEHLTRTDRG